MEGSCENRVRRVVGNYWDTQTNSRRFLVEVATISSIYDLILISPMFIVALCDLEWAKWDFLLLSKLLALFSSTDFTVATCILLHLLSVQTFYCLNGHVYMSPGAVYASNFL